MSLLAGYRLTSGATVAGLALVVPILVVIGQSVTGASGVWAHLRQTVLGDYVVNSVLLSLGVGTLVLLIGVPAAWLTARCEFPGRKWLDLLLMLPLAIPAYIIAYTYTGILDFAGPVQSAIRDYTGWRYGEYWFFEIRSLNGAILMLSLVLYPYVYLMSRAAFIRLPQQFFETSRSLGVAPFQGFFKVVLPMVRPSIVVGLALALMETLADYGTVEYFGVSTFTTGIFRTFYGFGDGTAAAQLSVSLLCVVLLLLMLEKHSRRRMSYHATNSESQAPLRWQLQGGVKWLASVSCFLPPLLGFLLPAAILLNWSLRSDELGSAQFFEIAWHSFSLAGGAAILSLTLAFLLAYALRLHRSPINRFTVQMASMGYALPGTIIAIGVVTALTWLDHQLVARVEAWLNGFGFELNFGLLFSGTVVALLFAYSVRFMAVSLGAVQSGLQTITPSFDHSARLLGNSPAKVLTKIHLPLLRGSALTAMLIVFVDVLKELPATLMLRPFDFNTLAVRAYELASDERLVDAAPASIMIVLVGLLPVLLLNQSIIGRR